MSGAQARPTGGQLRAVSVALLMLVVAALAGLAAREAQTGAGSISGRVTVTGLADLSRTIAAYPSRTVSRAAPPSVPSVRNVVVYLKTAPAAKDLDIRAAEIAQRDEAFVPRVVAVTRGSSVAFRNADPFFHNVFSLSRPTRFNLGRYPRGRSRDWRFDRPGLVRVFCDIHSNMSATVLVFDHRFFAVPSDDGTFHLDNVPPGNHTLVAWHDRAGEQERSLLVAVGQDTTTDFVLPVKEP